MANDKPSDLEVYKAQLVVACAEKEKKASKAKPRKKSKENVNPQAELDWHMGWWHKVETHATCHCVSPYLLSLNIYVRSFSCLSVGQKRRTGTSPSAWLLCIIEDSAAYKVAFNKESSMKCICSLLSLSCCRHNYSTIRDHCSVHLYISVLRQCDGMM